MTYGVDIGDGRRLTVYSEDEIFGYQYATRYGKLKPNGQPTEESLKEFESPLRRQEALSNEIDSIERKKTLAIILPMIGGIISLTIIMITRLFY